LIAANDRARPENQAEVLTIPFAPDALQNAVKRAIRRTELEREVKSLRAQVGGPAHIPGVADGNGHSAHLGWIRNLPPRFDLRDLLSSVEKTVILRTLEATKGAQAEAARRLGLSRSDLSYKLAKYELRKPASERPSDPS
jgi:DNA-binding NtrC family response regulator